MADQKLKGYCFFINMNILKFFLWIWIMRNPNPIAEFQNSKWRIQYGRSKVRKLLYFIKIFRSLDFWGCWIQIKKQNFKIRDGGSNIADQNFENSSIFNFWSAILNLKIPLSDLDSTIPKTWIINQIKWIERLFFCHCSSK